MTQYHVTLNGQGYLLDLGRYRKRRRQPFAEKRSEGALSIADLSGPEQVLSVTDWSGGDGHVAHDAAGGYRAGSGVDGSSEPGSLKLGPHAAVAATTTEAALNAMAVFNTRLYVAGESGTIYTWDGATWATVGTLGVTNPIALAVYEGSLYVGSGVSVSLFKVTTAGAISTVGAIGGGIWSLCTHYREGVQYLYVGGAGAGAGGVGRLYSWDGATLSAGQFDPEELVPAALVPADGRMYVVGGELGAAQRWALYSVDEGGAGGTWTAHARVVGGAGVAAALVDGVLYVGCVATGRIWAWDGSSLRVLRELAGPGGTYGSGLYGLCAWRGALWVGVAEGGAISLWRYDPRRASWSRPVTGLTGTLARSMAVFGADLYVGTSQAGAARLYRVRASAFGASGSVESGLIDFGLPGVTKLLRSVTIDVAAIAAGQGVQVEYRREDSGAWTSLGTLATAGATSATYGFGAGTTCRQLALRLTLTGAAGATASPTVYQVAVRYVPRPSLLREWELAVVLEGTPELPLATLDGEAAPLTGAQLTQLLWAAAGQVGPLTLVDLDGASYSVYVEDVREEVAKVSQRTGYQRVGLVRLVEAA